MSERAPKFTPEHGGSIGKPEEKAVRPERRPTEARPSLPAEVRVSKTPAGVIEQSPRKPKPGEAREIPKPFQEKEEPRDGKANTAEFMAQRDVDALALAKENARRAAKRGGAEKKWTPDATKPGGPEDPNDTPPSRRAEKETPYRRAPEQMYAPDRTVGSKSNTVDLAAQRGARTGQLDRVKLDPNREPTMASRPVAETARREKAGSSGEILQIRESDKEVWNQWTDYIVNTYSERLHAGMTEDEVYTMITATEKRRLPEADHRRVLAKEVMKRLLELGMEEKNRAALVDEMKKMQRRMAEFDAKISAIKNGTGRPEDFADAQKQRREAADRVRAIQAQINGGLKAA
ncbi:MAG: hypothetical protein O3B64_03115 [bacterium]|nr:hypothetical protein [bacterium]MDA1024413.1 hypothetical protein [bacterium]